MMKLENRRLEFGQLLKGFREHCLELSLFELGEMLGVDKASLWHLEARRRKFINIDVLFALLDLGFPFHNLKDYGMERNMREYLKLKKFKMKLKNNSKMEFRFKMYCEMNEEYIRENYVGGVLEHIRK